MPSIEVELKELTLGGPLKSVLIEIQKLIAKYGGDSDLDIVADYDRYICIYITHARDITDAEVNKPKGI